MKRRDPVNLPVLATPFTLNVLCSPHPESTALALGWDRGLGGRDTATCKQSRQRNLCQSCELLGAGCDISGNVTLALGLGGLEWGAGMAFHHVGKGITGRGSWEKKAQRLGHPAHWG